MAGIRWKGSKDGGMKARVKRMEDNIQTRLDRWAQETATEIQTLTGRGIDANGKKFKAYAKTTARRKMAKQGSVLVNLTETGQMLKNLFTNTVSKATGGARAVLYVSGSSTSKGRTVSNAEKVRHNEALGRTFFKLSARQYRRLRESMRNLLKK
jgi:hypothetical protein